MKWVKCVNPLAAGLTSYYKNLTLGKIYKVVEIGPPGIIRIINDADEERGVFTADFEDVTTEVITNERDKKLNDLGI
jgi:hypothetical protein